MVGMSCTLFTLVHAIDLVHQGLHLCILPVFATAGDQGMDAGG